MPNGNPAPGPLNSRYFRPVRGKGTRARRWDLQFESTSLQRRVLCEPGDAGHCRPLLGRRPLCPVPGRKGPPRRARLSSLLLSGPSILAVIELRPSSGPGCAAKRVAVGLDRLDQQVQQRAGLDVVEVELHHEAADRANTAP
jgi:hypothetical protein